MTTQLAYDAALVHRVHGLEFTSESMLTLESKEK
jgi:hypothetical protein